MNLFFAFSRSLASSIKKPFEVRYNPYTQTVQVLSTTGKIMDIAKELKGDVFLIANAMRKIQVNIKYSNRMYLKHTCVLI